MSDECGPNGRSRPTITRRAVLGLGLSSVITSALGAEPATAQKAGTQLWTFETGDAISSAPAVVDGTVFAGSYDGNLYAVNAETGKETWKFNAGSFVDSPPTVADGTVYVGSHAGDLYAVDTETGDPKWAFQADDWIKSSPAVADGTVYVGSWDDNLYAIAANSGDRQWTFETGGDVPSPTVTDDSVYIGSADSNLYAVDTETSEQRWAFQAGDAVESSPAVADDKVFVGTAGGRLYGVTTERGTKQWEFDTGARIFSSPTVDDDVVYVGSDNGTLYAVSADNGIQKWSFETGARIRTTPTVVDDTVYVGSQDGSLYAIAADTGEELWTFATDNGISSPTVVDGTVYVGSENGTLYAVATTASIFPNVSPVVIGGAVTATLGSVGLYRWRAGRGGTDDDPPEKFQLTPNDVSDELDSVESQIADARRAKEADEYDKAVDLCERAIDTANAATNAARDANDDQLSEAQSLASTARGLKETVTAERDTYQSVSNQLETITERINAAFDEREAGNRQAMLSHIDRAKKMINQTRATARNHGLQSILDRLDIAEKRCNRIRALETAQGEDENRGRPHTEVREPSQETTTTGQSVPQTIPSTPRLSVSYDDIKRGDPLGSGGNADVYRAAVSTDSGEFELAIKEPRMAGTIDTSRTDQLLAEAETWQQLDDHDHIVSVVDYGETPIPWIAMEYMDGGSLGQRAGELSFEQALWTSLAITRGVRHAHKRGVAHLDLKPENILFRSVADAWDVPKIADWGLSKHLLNHSQSVEGLSPHYAAPEQFDSDQFGPTDSVTDVYQLGAVCYELFTSQPPFDGQTYEIINKVQTESPDPPSQHVSLPQALDDILLQALATEKQDRYEDIILMRNDLEQLWEKYGERI